MSEEQVYGNWSRDRNFSDLGEKRNDGIKLLTGIISGPYQVTTIGPIVYKSYWLSPLLSMPLLCRTTYSLFTASSLSRPPPPSNNHFRPCKRIRDSILRNPVPSLRTSLTVESEGWMFFLFA